MGLHSIVDAIMDVAHHIVGFLIDAAFYLVEGFINLWAGNYNTDQHEEKRKAARKAVSDKFFKERFDDKNQTPPSPPNQ